MICPQCESYVSENMAFCPFCGFKVNPELTKPPVSKETNPKTEIGNTNFFGSAFPHKQEEEDFGLITSTIENPQIEESEDFSGRMFSALSEMISNTETASYETAKQAVLQQDEIIQSDSAPSQTANQAEQIIEQVEEQINDSADQQLSETVQQAEDALTETKSELPEQTQDAQEQNGDEAPEQISEASEQPQQETEPAAEETVEQTDETAEQAEQTIEQVEDETAKQAEQADEAAAEAEEIPVLELADTAEQTDEDTSDLHQDSMENPTEANNIPAEEEITEPEQEISAEEKPAEAEQSDLSESEQQDTEPEQEKETSVPEQENTEAADDQADKAVEQAEQPDESAPEAEETVEKAAEPEKEAADEDNPAEPEQENSAEVKNDEPKQEMPAEENITAPEQEHNTEKEQEISLSDEEETEEYLQQAVAILYGDDFKKGKTDRRVPYVPVFAVQDIEATSRQEKSAETDDKSEQAEQGAQKPDTDKDTAEEPETVKEAVSDIDKNSKIIELSANKTDTIEQATEEAVNETAEQTQDADEVTAEKETEEAAEKNIQKSEEAEKPSEAADEDDSQSEKSAQDDEQTAEESAEESEEAESSDESEEQDEQSADDNEDDTQDDDEEDEDFYEIKRSFFPDSYPSVDYSKLPANDAYRRYQQQKDKAAADNGTYDDYAYEDIDQGPDILSDIRYREEPTEDNSTISVSDTLKKASGKLGSIFRKKSNDEHNSDGNSKPKRKHRLLFITKKEEMEEIKPFVVTFDDDFVNSHTSEEELPPAIAEREAAEDEKAPAKKAEKPEKTPKKTAKTSDIKKLIPIIGAAAAVLVVAIALILIISSSKGSYKKNLFPEVYYDNGKIVLLKSERAEDKHNIASSGVESLDDVHYFNDIGCIYYVKNNDLYCYTISKLESMRIVRNVYSYSFFDDGKKVCAVSEDGKVYCFNGKDIAALSKGNDPVKSNSLSYVCGDNYSSALYLDGYNTATGSAILCKLDKSCKGKAILEIPAGTKKIEYFLGKYIMLTDSSSTGMLYDLSGKPIAPFEGYSSTIELGENSLIIRCGDSYDLFSKNEITDFDSGAAEILAVSKTADKFCYKASNGICYYYNNGKINDVCDASANSKLLFDIDGGCAYGIINDILFYYNIGKTVKQTPVCNGIKDVVFDENSRTWLASDDNCILKLDGSKASEITYEKTRDYPMISSDGKSFLAINSEGQLVKLTGNSESVISDNVTAFDSDSSFKNIVFVSGDRIYLNELESKITTVRDPESFQFCEAE